MNFKKNNLYDLISILKIGNKTQLFFLIILSLFSIFFEILGIGSIFIFISKLVNQELVLFTGQQKFLSEITSFSSASSKTFLLILLFLSFTASFCLKVVLSIIQTRFTFLTAMELSNRCLNKSIHFRIHDMLSRHSSEIISTIITKINLCAVHILFPVIGAFTAFSTIFFMTIFLFYVNFKITLIFISSTILSYLIIIKFTKNIILIAKKNIKKSDFLMIKILQEIINGFREIKLNNLENTLYHSFQFENKELRTAQINSRLVSILPRLIIEFIFVTTIVIVTFVSLQNEDKTIIPFLGGFLLSMQRLLPAINQVYVAFTGFKTNSLVLEEVIKFQENNVLKNNNIETINFKVKNIIEFKNLSFSHNNNSEVFKNVSFKIPTGSKILVIGDSGSGKSTFLDLIAGLLNPTVGNLLVGNGFLSQSNLKYWHNEILYISQSPFIFNDSIKKNISLNFKENTNLERLQVALRKAEIFEEIQKLPKKTSFVLSEKGSNLSGGQKQRIAIARAFYNPKKIMLFDEVTNSISKEKEKKIIENIIDLGNKHTVFFISHSNLEYSKWDMVIQIKDKKIKLYNR